MATLNANALTTLADLKQELNISVSTYDNYLTLLINVASDTLCNSCNRQFQYQNQITEAVSGYASTYLQVTQATPIDTNQPIAVLFNGAAYNSNAYSVNAQQAKSGLIFNMWGWYWTALRMPNVQQDPYVGQENPLYSITYSGGFLTPQQVASSYTPNTGALLPADIELAAIKMCTMWYRQQGQDPSLESERLLSYSYKFTEMKKIPEVQSVIQRYQRLAMST